jgi:NAD(P)-dependent dehydrogenase (short-subunit alcohol dehydrogenase family)
MKRGRGSIVNVCLGQFFLSAGFGRERLRRGEAALVNFTKAISEEFGPLGYSYQFGIPGPVSTDLWLGKCGGADTVARATSVDADTARARIIAEMGGIPTGRFSTPEEGVTLVMMLASERTANVAGANYVIDGGLFKTT